MDSYKTGEPNRTDIAHIGKSVLIRGELSGSEDLFVDGQVEGSIELREHHLTVGPNARVRASVNAREVVVQGSVDGNITARDRIELRKSAVVNGDILTQRIVVEDGAWMKGKLDTRKDVLQQPRAEQKPVAAPTVTPTPASAPSPALAPSVSAGNPANGSPASGESTSATPATAVSKA
jgi:cytoskeletal protein CcmA (bactofilin family)